LLSKDDHNIFGRRKTQIDKNILGRIFGIEELTNRQIDKNILARIFEIEELTN